MERQIGKRGNARKTESAFRNVERKALLSQLE